MLGGHPCAKIITHFRARGLHLRKHARRLRQNLPIMVSITVSITVLGGWPEKNRAGKTVLPSSGQSECGLIAPLWEFLTRAALGRDPEP